MKTEAEIKQKRVELSQKMDYLHDFLSDCYKGSDARQKAEKELSAIRREINMLSWVLNDLPF